MKMRWQSYGRGALMSAMLLAGCSGDSASAPVTVPPVTPIPVPTPTPTPTPSPSPTSTPIASALSQSDARVGACVNLGNHLEPPNEGDWGRALTDQDLADIAAKGFETVRLPARFSGHQGAGPDYVIDPAFLDRVEHLVDVARANGLRVIVDNHNFDALMADPAANTAQLTAIWRQVAERLKNKDTKVWFEILNEPNANLVDASLVATLGPSLAAIRVDNPTRPVVIGGQFWSGINSLATVPIFDDAYLIYTFHYYDPFNFTHQGATWIDPIPPFGVTFGSPADLTELSNNAEKARDFIADRGRPVFLGEYGANELIALDERAAYYKAVHDAFAAVQVDGCVWAYTNTFPVRDASSGTWFDGILAAIGL